MKHIKLFEDYSNKYKTIVILGLPGSGKSHLANKILKENVDFAFNTPVISQNFENNPMNNFKVPEIVKAKQDKSPVQILEERFARGEISAVDFQTAIRLLKVRKDYLNENENKTEQHKEVEHN